MKFILGAGITGLLWKYYFPEYELVSPDIDATTFLSGSIIIIHDSAETRMLLRDLDLPIIPASLPVMYATKLFGTDVFCHKPSARLLSDAIHKKKVTWNSINRDHEELPPKMTSMSMSSNEGKMNCLRISLKDIYYALVKKCETTTTYVTSIKEDLIGFGSSIGNTSI